MSDGDVFQLSLIAGLDEIFDGPSERGGYILNRGDVGMLRELESIDAATASRRPMAGKTTIAGHVDHVLYCFDLLNRWADGEKNPWATADWDVSWKHGVVDDAAWKSLVSRLRAASKKWREHAAKRTEWDDNAAGGALSSLAHTAYHMGAIRQILAANGKR